ncbi:esterase-like activity of phytase family protein [Azoarcus sp. L1K30]|uniref:esterase-like activity of phytase family protein n=1 Tax=Azoarcus sp. L1K30 TaxID=2820277 RepID=UPI001B8463A9|nr:esterase-like activity of phytase family protein [Azoarcus sp. L1K30]MBR0567519.1 esterase-like activity of phytase family protein [Azoarcus sp. L1K30]
MAVSKYFCEYPAMKLNLSFALSPLVLSLVLSGCVGGSDSDAFKYPGLEGTMLPYSLLMTVGNAEATQIRQGGFGSAMAGHPDKDGYFYALTDRGPNADTAAGVVPAGKIFVTPDYTPRIGLFRLDSKGEVKLVRSILLKDPAGRPITGLPNSSFGSTGETPYALDGSVVSLDPDGDGIAGYDESGLDPEGLVAMADGSFWVSDEYGPHMVHFAADGKEIERINAFAADPRNRTGRVLPAELSTRWPNRGMEGLAITPDGKTLVGVMQSNLYNPSKAAVGSINLTRIVTINIETGATAQYLYRQDAAGLANSEIVALTATSFLMVERDTKFFGIDTGAIRKNVYKVDLTGATNVDRSNTTLVAANAAFGVSATNGLEIDGKTLEEVIKNAGSDGNFAAGWAELASYSIQPATKSLVYDAIAAQHYPHDKMEGLWVIDSTHLGIINDDDFAIAPDGSGGVEQKKLFDGSVDRNMLYVVDLPTPLY